MRRGTWLVAGGVLALAAVALADAVRREATETRSTIPAATSTADPAPREQGLGGVLYYTDESCRLHALAFPDLEPEEAPPFRSCTVSLSADGQRVEPGDVAWHPGGSVLAGSDGPGTTLVLLDDGADEPSRYRFRGRAPAFGEHGLLTFAFGEQIRAMDAGCPLSREPGPWIEAATIRGCSEVLVSEGAIRTAARRHLNAPSGPAYPLSVTVRELAWLDGSRFVALLRLHVPRIGDFDLIALFAGGALVETVAGLEPLHHLRTSPDGRWLAVLTSAGRVLHFSRDGRSQPMPNVAGARSFDWSPDGNWLAIATPNSLYVARPGAVPPSSRRFELVAEDLAWR